MSAKRGELSRVVNDDDESRPLVLSSFRVRGSALLSLASSATVLFLATSVISLLGVAMPKLVPIFHLTVVQSNALVSSPLIFAGIFSVPISLLSEKYGARYLSAGLLLLISMALFALSAIIQWDLVSNVFGLFFVCGMFLGCSGLIFNATITQLTSWFPLARQGSVYGLMMLAYGLGPPVLSAYSTPFASRFGFPALFLFTACQLFAAALVAFVCVQDAPFLQLTRKAGKSMSHPELVCSF